ncbi:arylamine N-acetyltransferase family protein [Streptomyces sp. NBC_00344]|uniref:arylamine N-acetyltransferase family protein n=1 Tax=Streptomyces sp. NBC_00344 TaxID=2975720 RepID=UPI002E1BD0AA
MTWSGEQLDMDAYLTRIGHQGETDAAVGTLRALHRAHVAAIPFENLDVALGRPVSLDTKSIQDKLVARRRGGYCYEQNSLLAAALERLGFEVTARGARNRTRGATITPVTHALLVVAIGGEQWLVDAGFGAQGVLEPIPLRDGAVVVQDGWTFGIALEDDGIHVLRALRPEGWSDLYAFAPQVLYPGDFEVMNHYSSTHPQSKFVGQVVAQCRRSGVRLMLVRDELTSVCADGTVERRRIASDDLGRVLAGEFGIDVAAADARRLAALSQ